MAAGRETEPQPQDPRPAQKRPDRFVIWPVWIPIGATLAAATAVSMSPFGGAMSLLLWPIAVCGWLIVVLVMAGLAAWRRAWRRCASLVANVVCAVPAAALSLRAGDYIHLLLAFPSYATVIAAAPADSGPIRFNDWPSAGLIPSYVRTLIYDPSDELASQIGSQVIQIEGRPGWRNVRHLMWHFYLDEFGW